MLVLILGGKEVKDNIGMIRRVLAEGGEVKIEGGRETYGNPGNDESLSWYESWKSCTLFYGRSPTEKEWEEWGKKVGKRL